MKIKALDVLEKEAQSTELQVDPETLLEMYDSDDDNELSDDEIEKMLEEGVDLKKEDVGPLEYAYKAKDEPDRLRTVDPKGQFWDVIKFPDGSVGVQKVDVRVHYDNPVEKHEDWLEAEDALPQGWEPYKAINARRVQVVQGKKQVISAQREVLVAHSGDSQFSDKHLVHVKDAATEAEVIIDTQRNPYK